jgi:transposase InsO family protein
VPTKLGIPTSVIDLFDRKVIGWQLGNILRAEDTVIPIPALNKDCSNRTIQVDQQLIFHSDRGIQYACQQFKASKSLMNRINLNTKVA